METPEFFQPNYYNAQFATEKRLSNAKISDPFVIEDLLDFPNDETMVAADNGGITAAVTGTSPDSSTADTSCNSSFSTGGEQNFQAADNMGGPRGYAADGNFSHELCVPYDDVAELEWLSNFVDESFSPELELDKLHLVQGMKARTNQPSQAHQHTFQPESTRQGPIPILRPEMMVPAKARSKRSRAAPGNWTSRLLAVAPTPPPANAPAATSSSESDVAATVEKSAGAHKKKESPADTPVAGEGRRCLHCDTDKTPQWRTGPMGPKTLCNACGVRYKSGRLVPEYRPAASPTFVLTKHSNSHRKVLELRRQKEMMRVQQHQQQFMHHHQGMMFDVSNGDDYMIHQHIGPDFRQMI